MGSAKSAGHKNWNVRLGGVSGPLLPLVVSVSAEGTIYIMDSEIAQDTLTEKLAAITDNKADTRIFVRGDKSIDYGRVMEVMGLIKDAGFTKVALIAELPARDS